jgi:hypothetical protein
MSIVYLKKKGMGYIAQERGKIEGNGKKYVISNYVNSTLQQIKM